MKAIRNGDVKNSGKSKHDNIDFNLKGYIPIVGKKYYYNSCPCGNDARKVQETITTTTSAPTPRTKRDIEDTE